MFGERRKFWRDQAGAVYVEVAATISLFILILFGTVEFSYIFYQWNLGSKATQVGARLAAVSWPVSAGMVGITSTTNTGLLAGQTLSPGAYDITCQGAAGTPTCTCTSSMSICPTLDPRASVMDIIAYGRCEPAHETCSSDIISGQTFYYRTACRYQVSGQYFNFDNIGMCNVIDEGFPEQVNSGLPRHLVPQNITVEYSFTGLGYAGRPGGPVPTVTVKLAVLQYKFIFIGGFLNGANTIQMPSFATTVTGEDLDSVGS